MRKGFEFFSVAGVSRGNSAGTRLGIARIFGKNLAQVLLFVLDHRQVDEQEDDHEKRRQSRTAGSDGESGGHQQGSDVERVARVGIGPAGGELLILREAAGGPGAQARGRAATAECRSPWTAASGWENQAKTMTIRNPLGTRRRATASAYGFGEWIIRPCFPRDGAARGASLSGARRPGQERSVACWGR